MPRLPKGTEFTVPRRGTKKYTAAIPQRGGTVKRVSFGHRGYEHYRDQVPKQMGGGRWARRDHNDKERRRRYRARHGGMKCKDGRACVTKRYSPAWFSWHFLW